MYNHKYNIIVEIKLYDYNLINDVVYNFCSFMDVDTNLKISMANSYLVDYLDDNLSYEEYIERTLYKINNSKLKGIYIPRSDLI